MINVDDYISYFKKEEKSMIESGFFKSKPKFLFIYDKNKEEMVFNPDNWNGCDILRRWLYKNVYFHIITDLYSIYYYTIDDDTFIFILTNSDFYSIKWYKSRGRTDSIEKNGEPINIHDYIRLCNLLNIEIE